jgi:hypothetical protein
VAPRADWFADANATGLGHALAAAHLPVTWIGDDGKQRRRKKAHWLEPCPVTDHGEADDVWIPKIAGYGAAILTRDEHIATRLLEHEAVRGASARLFAITSGGSLSLWELVQVVASRWAWLEEARQEPGPIIYGFTRTTHHVVRSW